MAYVIFIRVSTDDQAQSGLGLEAQLASCQAYAKRAGGEIAAVCRDEGVSGGVSLDRCPGLLEAIGTLRRGDVLLVAKRDRLGRDPLRLAMVEASVARKGARIISAAGEGTDSDDPSAVLMRRMVDAFGEYERLLIKARTKSALQAKMARGERAYRDKLGFQIVGKNVVKDEAESQVVDRIKAMHLSGLGHRRIAEVLTIEGVPTKRGGKIWQRSTIQRILERATA